MASDIADKLDEARALIEKGWTQEEFIHENDAGLWCYCASGAIGAVTADSSFIGEEDEDEQPPAFRAAIAALASAVGCAPYSYEIARWNDAKGRTQAEVVDALKRAAELAREQSA